MDQDFRHSLTQKERAESVSTTFNTPVELHDTGHRSGKKLVKWNADVFQYKLI